MFLWASNKKEMLHLAQHLGAAALTSPGDSPALKLEKPRASVAVLRLQGQAALAGQWGDAGVGFKDLGVNPCPGTYGCVKLG